MERRLFLKTAVTTCGVVMVGIPHVMATTGRIKSSTSKPIGQLRFLGDKNRGCAVSDYRRNHHDSFPQDIANLPL